MARALNAVRFTRALFVSSLATVSCACGSSAAGTATTKALGVSITGAVARICAGPLIVGRPPHCMDRAVFKRAGKSWTVHGQFSIRLPRGVYAVVIDGCSSTQRLHVEQARSGLKLIPHCALPL